jgi:hypothetical protein
MRQSLEKLEATDEGEKSVHAKLFEDCHQRLRYCEECSMQRNEMIHTLWVSQALPPSSATRLRMTRPKGGQISQIETHGHNVAELRALAVKIRNEAYEIHALMVKFRGAFQKLKNSEIKKDWEE